MKRLLFTPLFAAFSIYSLWAQSSLDARTQWEKNYGASLLGEVALGWPVSKATPNGNILFSFPYRLCASKCSTSIVYRSIARDSLYKTNGSYVPSQGGAGAFVKGYSTKLSSDWDEATNKFYTTSTYYSPNFDEIGRVTQQQPAYISSVNPLSGGGVVISTTPNLGGYSEGLVRYDAQGKKVWNIATMNYTRTQRDTSWWTSGTATPMYQGEEAGFISSKSVRDANNLNTILSQQADLKVILASGVEKWHTSIESPSDNIKVVGTDTKGQWYVLNQRDSIGRVLTFSGEGVKVNEVVISMPNLYSHTSALEIQKTADEGFVLFCRNVVNTFFAKYSKTGAREWNYQMPPNLDQLKITPTGNIIAYTSYLNQYNLVILSPTGTEKSKLTLFHLLEASNGWLYGTTMDKLYAINPQGEIAWTINRAVARAVVSEDLDGNLLLTETFSTKNPTASIYLNAWNLDVVNTFTLSKYSKEGKLLWKTPINTTVGEPNYQVRFMAGAYPSKETKDAYLLTSQVITMSKNAGIGNQSNVNYTTSVIKIARPCYTQLTATLATTSPSLCGGQTVKLEANADSLAFLSYQWQRDGQMIITNRQSTFETTTEGVYRVMVSDSVCGTSSLSSTIEIKSTPNASVTLVTTPPVYAPNKAKLQANEGAGLTYQWLKNGQEIVGAVASSYETAESGAFSVKVSRDGCSRTSPPLTVEVMLPLGVEGTTETELHVSPNPNVGEFELKLPTGWERAQIKLQDVLGRDVPVNQSNDRVTVQTGAGMYWLKAQLEGRELTQKVVIRP